MLGHLRPPSLAPEAGHEKARLLGGLSIERCGRASAHHPEDGGNDPDLTCICAAHADTGTTPPAIRQWRWQVQTTAAFIAR